MKLFIKKFVSNNLGEATWWIYCSKDGRGYAINAFYNYREAKSCLEDYRDFPSQQDYTAIIERTAKIHKNTFYEPALVINE